MDIDQMTIGEAREIATLLGGGARPDAGPWRVGECYLIRTVTMIQVGRIVAVHDKELLLSDASWVADTGRFHEALSTGVLSEVEPFAGGICIVGRGALIDAAPWEHDLPTVAK